jgi:hypothetical protein
MKIGTKTLLFGDHQFILHPYYAYKAWKKLYGKRPNWKELICIIIHDWGYWGLDEIDGLNGGDDHPYWASTWANNHLEDTHESTDPRFMYYIKLCLYHSEALATRNGEHVSKLYWADKLGTASMPPWLWVGLGKLTGEMENYCSNPKYHRDGIGADPYKHFQHFRDVMARKIFDNFIIDTPELTRCVLKLVGAK